MNPAKGEFFVGAWAHVGNKANNYFSIIKIISNAQFFISN